jgi:hypothetical protein
MGGLQSGGGTSAVAASAHAGCARFRLTDPFLTNKTRRALAKHIGAPDTGVGIPEARWMRAVTFESLIRSDGFVSELLTKTIGQLGLPRPEGVRRRDCGDRIDPTASEVALAHEIAVEKQASTMLTGLAVPFPGLEHVPKATPVKPDFAVISPASDSSEGPASWLVMGDAKDYERVRSRIDDQRILKGFLQVALGAESIEGWSHLPAGMGVHRYGALAVPRNAFLQPEAIVEQLDDHRREVRSRAEERLRAREELGEDRPTEEELHEYVAHIEATFDPDSCVSCNLFSYCRQELRTSKDAAAVLTEIGVAPSERPLVFGLVDGSGEAAAEAPTALVELVKATTSGLASPTGRLRQDPCGLPGAIDVVLVKSDAGALGVHGIAVRSAAQWEWAVYDDPLSSETRRGVMSILGEAVQEMLDEGRWPIHMVVPDRPTADLLATIADSLAGVELSRLRWERDLEKSRPALTFDGEKATIPLALSPDQRLAVSFLLEEDRARALSLRSPIVILRDVLDSYYFVGGPAGDAGRLDYLVEWVNASQPLDHRALSDDIADRTGTPGARLSNQLSDQIHAESRSDGSKYEALVGEALDYRIEVVESALGILDGITPSRLREVHEILESDAQEVWARRVALHASDLVRFSRTSQVWRNDQVGIIEGNRRCDEQLAVLGDFSRAIECAEDPANGDVASAEVIGVDPYRLSVRSRQIGAGSIVVAVHANGRALVESDEVTLKSQKGSFKFGGLALGMLTETDEEHEFDWQPKVDPGFEVGDQVTLAGALWFRDPPLNSGHEISVARPSLDTQSAPKETCEPDSYELDPVAHRWCCRPHEAAEAEWSDALAGRRDRGELNPDTWPPLVDEERFDIGDPVPEAEVSESQPPETLSMDDLD